MYNYKEHKSLKCADDKLIRSTFSYDPKIGLYGKKGHLLRSDIASLYTYNIKYSSNKNLAAWYMYYNYWPVQQIYAIDGDNCNAKLENLKLSTGVSKFITHDNKDTYYMVAIEDGLHREAFKTYEEAKARADERYILRTLDIKKPQRQHATEALRQ